MMTKIFTFGLKTLSALSTLSVLCGILLHVGMQHHALPRSVLLSAALFASLAFSPSGYI